MGFQKEVKDEHINLEIISYLVICKATGLDKVNMENVYRGEVLILRQAQEFGTEGGTNKGKLRNGGLVKQKDKQDCMVSWKPNKVFQKRKEQLSMLLTGQEVENQECKV